MFCRVTFLSASCHIIRSLSPTPPVKSSPTPRSMIGVGLDPMSVSKRRSILLHISLTEDIKKAAFNYNNKDVSVCTPIHYSFSLLHRFINKQITK